MTWFSRKPPATTTFRASAPDGVWQVTRDGILTSDYPSRGDAVRAACRAARDVDAHGGSAQVLLPPSNAVLPHLEPHLDNGSEEAPYSLLARRAH